MENRDKIVVLLAGGRIVQRHELHDTTELSEEELHSAFEEATDDIVAKLKKNI